MKEDRTGEANVYDYTRLHSDFNSLSLRMDPSTILNDIEVYLKGYYIQTVLNEDTGKTEVMEVSVGEPLVNKRGVQKLMFWLKSKFNSINTQMNLSERQYWTFLKNSRIALARDLMINLKEYGLKETNYSGIIDTVMEALQLYLTGTIGGFFMKNITPTMKTVETHTVGEREGRKKLLGFI